MAPSENDRYPAWTAIEGAGFVSEGLIVESRIFARQM